MRSHTLVLGAGLALVSYVRADFEQIIDQITKLIDDDEDRSTPSFIPEHLPLLDGWGCWCNFDSDTFDGHGIPINEIDKACKVLVNGYKCSILDAIDNGEPECRPFEIPYNSSTGFGTLETIVSSCTLINPSDPCSLRSCIIEGHFVISVFSLFGNGFFIESQYSHANGFDPTTCTAPRANLFGPTECCGDYPVRYPFKTNNVRECCGQYTYNVNVMNCCNEQLSLTTCT
jgi:hypothetical protein